MRNTSAIIYTVSHICHAEGSEKMPKKKEPITPIYVRNAIARYDSKFKKILLRVSPELKEIIDANTGGKSVNQYIIDLIMDDLEKKGALPGEEDHEKENEFPSMPDGVTEKNPFQ